MRIKLTSKVVTLLPVLTHSNSLDSPWILPRLESSVWRDFSALRRVDAATFDMARLSPEGKCPEYSVHWCRNTTPGGQYYSSYSLIILIVGALPQPLRFTEMHPFNRFSMICSAALLAFRSMWTIALVS